MRFFVPAEIIHIWVLMVEIIHVIGESADGVGKYCYYRFIGHALSQGLPAAGMKFFGQVIFRQIILPL